MSTRPPSGEPPRRRERRAPEPRRGPFQKPKGVVLAGVTFVLLAVLGITLAQAFQRPVASPATPSAVPTPSLPPTPVPSTSASASASTAPKPSFSSPPPMTIDTSRHYTATIDTEKGTIVLDLDPQLAPVTVNNFVFLA
ncbi:MAG TPA: hypothetical protein VKU60_07595, partial [Chloroflexota bacterium]|nr:hypothetical protein [Chloroflexota bacterium]